MPAPIRVLTAVPICDGHDSAVNTINLEFIRHGIEVIYLGYHRYAEDMVRAAIQEDVSALGISSYNGGHVEFFAEVVRLLRKQGAADIKVTRGDIEFKNATFNYKNNQDIFTNFNLKIPAGQKVALVGSSGGGKSTVVKLLLRFYDLTGGAILVDGQDISRVTQESLRQQIALVPQDPILFHRPILENIRYARPDATDDEVIEVAKLAHCHEFVTGFADDYATMVGERGVKLSGGERQRVAIARALLKRAPILVLDEATSSVDTETELLIQRAIENLMKGRTSIVIAHRLSTIQKADKILVLDKGEIKEMGTHQQLLKLNGYYKNLYDLQLSSGGIPTA